MGRHLARFIPVLIALHSPSGAVIEINPDLVTHLRNREPGSKNFTEKANCMINMADGRFVTVVETCEAVRRAMEEARK